MLQIHASTKKKEMKKRTELNRWEEKKNSTYLQQPDFLIFEDTADVPSQSFTIFNVVGFKKYINKISSQKRPRPPAPH